jgi:hypothetical protein
MGTKKCTSEIGPQDFKFIVPVLDDPREKHFIEFATQGDLSIVRGSANELHVDRARAAEAMKC